MSHPTMEKTLPPLANDLGVSAVGEAGPGERGVSGGGELAGDSTFGVAGAFGGGLVEDTGGGVDGVLDGGLIGSCGGGEDGAFGGGLERGFGGGVDGDWGGGRGGGDLGGGDGVGTVSTSSFIPPPQCPGVAHMKYLLPGAVRVMVVEPSK